MNAAAFPHEQADDGSFRRQEDAFRSKIAPNPEPDRYHLYISYACPWAHRTAIVRKLMGLEKAVGLTAVDPVRDDRGWAFREGDGFTEDPVNGFRFLAEAYWASMPDFHGRVTVPVLWDKQERRIANNSEDDICRAFAESFRSLAAHPVDLFPAKIDEEHRKLSDFLYQRVNNGVYEAGFATTQAAYEKAVHALFDALDELDRRLASRRFLLAGEPVEADWRLFCTLIRFDAMYHGHFKCNVRRIVDYPALWPYLRDLYQWPGVAETVRLDHIKRHYYMTHPSINTTRIVPIGPDLDLTAPTGRQNFR